MNKTSTDELDPYANNPTPEQILQMVIGFYDPFTDVFDKYGMDLNKGTAAIEAYVEQKISQEQQRFMSILKDACDEAYLSAPDERSVMASVQVQLKEKS